MRKSIVAPLVFAAVLFVSGLSAAATPAKELPPGIAGHVSVRSLRGLIRNLDKYISAATKGSENEIPAGFLSMMTMIYMPVPMDDWESDGPVNFVALDSENPEEMTFVGFFQAPDFDRLMETLSESGWEIEDEIPDAEFQKVRPITFPSGDRRLLVDLGDGRIAIAEKLSDIAVIHAHDWFPAHMSDADVRANLALENTDNPLTSFVRDLVAQKKDELVANIDKIGFQSTFAEGVGRLLEKYAPLAAAEIDNTRFVLMEMRFADGIATIDLGVKFKPDSLGEKWIGGMERSGNLDLTLADHIRPGGVSASVSYPATRLLPDTPAQMSRFIGDVIGMLAPDLQVRAETAVREFYESKPGQSISSNYLKDSGTYTISYLPSERPAETLNSIIKVIDVLNDVWAKSITDPAHGAKLQAVESTLNDHPFYHFTEVYEDSEKFSEFLNHIHDVNPSVTIPFDPENSMQLFLASDGKGVIFGAGNIDETIFRAAVEHIREPEGKNLFQSQAAEMLIGRVEHDQAAVGMLDPAGLFSVYASAAAHAHDYSYGQPESNPYRVALEKLNPVPGNSESAIGFALGADKGWAINRFLLPAASVNEVAKLYDSYVKLRKEAARDLNVPDEIAPDQDGYEDDLDEDGEEDGEDEAAA